MKRIIFVIIFAVLLSVNIHAEDIGFSPEDILDSLPEEYKNNIPDNLILESNNYIPNTQVFINYVISTLKETIFPCLKDFSELLSVVLLCSILNILEKSFISGNYSKPVHLICLSVTALACYSLIINILSMTKKYITLLNEIMNAMLPIMTSIYIAGGNAATAVVNSSGIMLGLTVSNNILSYGLTPVLKLCFFMTFGSNIGDFTQLKVISKFTEKAFSFLLSSIMTFCSILLLFQTYISSSADGLAAKTVKFAGNLIPVVGSAIGDSVKVVMSSLSLIKSTCGVTAIVIILCVILPILIKLLIYKALFSVSGGVAEMLECKKESEFLIHIGNLTNYCLAICFSISIMFIFEIVIFIKTSLAMGQ